MSRRRALRLMAMTSAATWSPVQVTAARGRAEAALARAPQEPFEPAFFTEHEHATVRLLVDLILPADERSGSATDAGVPEFMDFMMRDRPAMQGWMRGGLAWLDIECRDRFDRDFIDASGEERALILDAIAWPDRADDELRHGVAFFNRFRDLTASGFWSTEMGIADLRYMGNRSVRQWSGCPEEALRHVGVVDGD